MPLIFEITREAQMIETERSQVKDLRSQGFSDGQMEAMGFAEASFRNPSVLKN